VLKKSLRKTEVAMAKKVSLTLLVALALLSVPASLRAQDSDKVVILTPRVGSIINQYERRRFDLFVGIKDFVQARIFVRSDSSYYARIEMSGEEGKTLDTTIAYSKDDLLILAERINHFADLQEGKYQTQGADVILLLKTGHQISGELLSVSDSTLIISTLGEVDIKVLSTQSAGIIAVRNEEIFHMVIKGKSNVLKGMILGTLVGVGFHVLVGLAAGANPLKAYFTDADPEARKAGVTYGALGLTVGTIAGIASSSRDKVIDPLLHQDFSFLRSFARFSDEEPQFLKKIK
jgi:hypothetical protein